jgi:outer membrane protein
MIRKRMFARTAVAAVLVWASGTSFALDLIGSYEKALAADPSQRAADEAVLAGREKAVQGRSLFKPQVALSANLNHVDDRSSGSTPAALASVIPSSSSGNVHEVALQLSKPLYNAGKKADRTQLQQQTELAEVNWRNARQDLIQRTGEAYFNVLLAQEHVRVVAAEKAAVQMQRDRAMARFDVGRAKVTDVQETQARYDSVLTKEVSAQSTLALRQAQYQELTGELAVGLAELRPGFTPSPPQPDNLLDWQAKGMQGHTRVLVKRSELEIAGAEIGRYKLNGRPTLDLVASYKDKGQNGGLSPLAAPEGRTAVLGLQFNVPLYSGGALTSREREAIAKQRQAEQELIAARRDARLQVQDAFLAVKTGVARIGSLEQSVASARTALAATTLGRDVGNRTELDVLDSQQRVYSSELELAQARTDYLLGRIRLGAAAGELQEGDLRALNAYLAP